MKKIALISTFCDTEEKQNILLENINILKNNSVDVMCLSPNFIPLNHEIIEKSDFVFYTKENPLLNWPERAFTFWKTIPTDKGWMKMTHFLSDYGWAALYQTKKLSEIALTFDYDIFYHMIYDTELCDTLINEIKSNETNIIHPRVDPNNSETLWETTLHFMVFDRELTKKISEEITLNEYLRTNGVAEGELLKWKNKFNIPTKEHPVKDRIFLYEDKDFFNYDLDSDYKIFINKHDDNLEIRKGDTPEEYIMNNNLRVILYEIKQDGTFKFTINDEIRTYQVKKSNNYTIEFDVKCDEIQNIYFDFNNKFVDFTENYKKIVRNCITYK